MACYTPLKAFKVGYKENGKEDIKITGYQTDHFELCDGSWVASPVSVISKSASRVCKDYYEIPCGKCIGCKADYAKQWADRCMIELSQHESSYFITLTYDDKNLPMTESIDQTTGVIRELPTLVKSDVSDFMKRLRKNTGLYLRFYGCGEYGSTTMRPHYHIIIFGLSLEDLEFYSISNGNVLYNSATIDKAWQNKGHCVVGEVTYESCSYVAGYVNKKLYGMDSEFFKNLLLQPEFTIMSRRPGIGGLEYEKLLFNGFEFDRTRSIVLSNIADNSSVSVTIPKYYKKKLKVDNPSLYEKVKQKNLDISEAVKAIKLSQTSKDYLGILESERLIKENRFRKGGNKHDAL